MAGCPLGHSRNQRNGHPGAVPYTPSSYNVSSYHAAAFLSSDVLRGSTDLLFCISLDTYTCKALDSHLPRHAFHPLFPLISLLLSFSSFQRDAFNGGSKADQAERGLTKEQRKAERIAAIRSSVIYSGHLLTKNVKESIFKSAWKDRYFVIASGVYSYVLMVISSYSLNDIRIRNSFFSLCQSH